MAYYFMTDTYIPDTGRGQYDEYISQVKEIVEGYGGEYLVRTDQVTPLDRGRAPQRCIVIRFPTKQAIDDCFSSPEYRAIMAKRTQSVDSRAVIVPGVEE